MFGLSVSKILLLALIVGAVVVGTRVLSRIGQEKRDGSRVGRKEDNAAVRGAVDLEQCSVCGTFHTQGKTADCGRSGCPYGA